MKTLLKNRSALLLAGRWDIDFHLPPEGIRRFPEEMLQRVDSVADIASEKRDPTREPEVGFQYIDIASVDVTTGSIMVPQDLTGEEAPSRARKVVRAFDIIVSTCRPTRGAIAVVPVALHNQIASTAFSIVRPRTNINPYYLHYALHLPSTLEQFRKWSTGSSYPAILDEDVEKTLIPIPSVEIQEAVAVQVMHAFRKREDAIRQANEEWQKGLISLTDAIAQSTPLRALNPASAKLPVSLAEVQSILAALPPLKYDAGGRRQKASADIDLEDLFSEIGEAA